MVVQFQTSFIPKKASVIEPPTQGIGGRSINLFAVIALFVFLSTVGLSAYVFFYKSHLIAVISDMNVSLAAAKKSFEPEFIDEAARLNARIDAAKELINIHQATSPLFDILEKKTLESVRFLDFNFNALSEGAVTLTMTGEAKSFNAVALQSDVFGAERSFKDPVFSNFTLSESGNVVFNFNTKIEPELLLYRETVLGENQEQTTTSSVPAVE